MPTSTRAATARTVAARTVAARTVVSVVVVNWNGASVLGECLDSLFAQTLREPYRVVVVDNGSTDASGDILARYGDALTLIRNPENRGFAAGSNQGMAAVESDFVALLNNDAAADPRWLEALLEVMRRAPDIGSCTSRILSYDDPEVLDNTGHLVYLDGLMRGRGHRQASRGRFEEVDEVFSASGCASMLRRQMLEDLGGFDEAFFAYCEDADLGMRARLRGWRCFYAPAAVVRHKFSASTSRFSPLKALNVERNRVWLAVKNLPPVLLLLNPVFTLIRYFWQAWFLLQGAGAGGRFARESSPWLLLRLLARAHWEGWAGLPRCLRQRREIQGRRKLSTRQLWRAMRRHGIGAREIARME